MDGYVEIAILENQIEAMLLRSVLQERGVPHLIRSYHDTAYDGLFQTQMGWGAVLGPESHRSEILEILHTLRRQAGAHEE
ncbi:MAG: hypothetical protein JRJ78_06120 [Deltaproteobacteria bacterium]|nr:hypothetical protein [Deltaproteobacteria bacterium]